MSYSVGQVARLAGVTVRTLHHYDETGLVSPSGRTAAGYRQYEDDDLLRLQQVLFYREPGFPLDEIAILLDDARVNALEHLRRQHGLLTARIVRLEEIRAAVQLAMEARQMGINLTAEEILEVFGEHDPTRYAEEVAERWGDNGTYRESTRRTSSYAKEQWLALRDEGEEIERRFAAAFTTGALPHSEAAMDVAEAHRQHISRWFYDCSHEFHCGLGNLYVEDPRFRAHYDELVPGLGEYVRDAIHANAHRVEG